MASTNPMRRRAAGPANPLPSGTLPDDAGAAIPAGGGDDEHVPSSIINSADCRLVSVRVKVVEYAPDGRELLRRHADPLVSVVVEVEVRHGPR